MNTQKTNKLIMPSLLKEGGPLAVGGFNKHQPAKRIVSLILSLAMLLTLTAGIDFSVYAWDNEGKYGDWSYRDHFTLKYDENGSSIYDSSAIDITGYKGTEENLVIPSTINGYPVKGIAEKAFYENQNLKNVVIPNGVIYIDSNVFDGCTCLENVSIPDGVIRIGDFAFSYCHSLTKITIPNSVISIGNNILYRTPLHDYENYYEDYWDNGLFYVDNFLLDVEDNVSICDIKNGTTVIADGIITNSDLTTVKIPNSVINVGNLSRAVLNDIFVESDNKYYSSQDGVLFNKDKTEIIYYPRGNSRTSYMIPNGVTSIGKHIFSGIRNLSSITIPDSVQNIEEYAFFNCEGLTDITIPDSIENINKGTFEGCTELTSIIIPKSVKIIDDYAFKGCTGLKSLTIPEGVTDIGFEAFNNCENLTEVYLPRTLEVIGNSAFNKCLNLKDVYYNGIEKNWNKIFINDQGNSCLLNADIHFAEFKTSDFQYAYLDDGSIEILKYIGSSSNVVIPNEIDGHKVTVIGDNAFADCTDLKNITFSENLTKIGNHAFENCSSISYVNLSETKINEIGDYAFKNCKELYAINLPDSYHEIARGTFYGCTQLEDISLVNIRGIDNYAFANCSSLTDLKIHAHIFEHAFVNCTNLKFVEIETIRIEEYAFSNCRNLKQVILKKGLSYIDLYAFKNCSNIDDVYYYGTQNQWKYLNFAESCFKDTGATIHYILKDKTEKFEYSTSDSKTAEIWKYYGNDSSCIIPSEIDGYRVNGIAAYAFSNNQNLVDITIPNTVTYIGHEAFGECSNLKNVYFSGTKDEWNKIEIDYSWESNYFLKNATIHFNEETKLPFADLNGYEYYNDYVTYTSVNNSFLKGTNPPYFTEFSPTTAITRAMFVTILYRMAGEPYADNNPYSLSPFSDIKDTSVYYYDAACWAIDKGITNQLTFKPFDNVTREQTASFLFRYADDTDNLGSEEYKNVDLSKYSDSKNISGWAVEAMQWANYNGMITGTQQGTANPQGATQRIHATKILYGFGDVCGIGNFA